VMHMTTIRQRLSKRIPRVTFSTTEGHTLLGNKPINTFLITEDGVF
jgi:hypothetical protein